VVASVYTSKGKTMAKIKVNIKGDEFSEIVEVGTRRIAPFTFFTKKRYLEEFTPLLP
jgi:hypothetical protein